MAQSINLAALGTFTKELSPEIFREAVLEGRFVKRIAHQADIKTAEYVNAIRSTLTLQAPSCGALPTFGASNSVVPFRNLLTVTAYEIQENLCQKDFDNTYMQQISKAGSYGEDITEQFATVYMADKASKIQKAIGASLIAGSTTGTFSSSYTLGNGLLHTLVLTSASASIVNGGITQSYNLTNAYGIIRDLVLLVPAAVSGEADLELSLSTADYRMFVQSAIATNNYHFTGEEGSDWSMLFPGTSVRIVRTTEFDSISNASYAHWFLLTPASNLVYGYDKLSDSTDSLYWYDTTLRTHRFLAEWKAGISFKYPEYIVLGKCN